MTTFTTIPNSSLEPGKPIRSIDGLALRDNPLAMFEGDSSAPRLFGKAIKRLEEMPELSVTAADTYDASIGSAPVSILNSTSSASDVVAFRYTIEKYTGSMRFKASHKVDIDGNNGFLSIYKNNILVQQFNHIYSYFYQRIVDISVIHGDVIEWRIRTSSVEFFQNDSISASNGYTNRLAYISQIDNLNA